MDPEVTLPGDEVLSESGSTPQIPEVTPQSAEPENQEAEPGNLEDSGGGVVEEPKENIVVEDEKVTEPIETSEATLPSHGALPESDSTEQIPEVTPQSAELENQEDNGGDVVEELKENIVVEDEKLTEPIETSEAQEPIVPSQEDAVSLAESEVAVEATVSQNIQ